MACLYTALGGIRLAIENAANLTALAARKTVSSTKKFTAIAGELAACILFESVLNILALLFIVKILGIHMRNDRFLVCSQLSSALPAASPLACF